MSRLSRPLSGSRPFQGRRLGDQDLVDLVDLPQPDLDDLAARTGFASGEALWRRYLEVTAGVRRFYARRFARSKEISVTEIEERVMEILDEDRDAASAAAAAAIGLGEGAIREMRRKRKT